MDKHRKAVIELCAAIEIANERGTHPVIESELEKDTTDAYMIDARDFAIILKLVADIKASFNHSMQYRYEQHYLRELDARLLARKEPAA